MRTATLLAKGPATNGTGKYQCKKCDHAPFDTPQGLGMHIGRVHTGKIKAHREGGVRRYTRRWSAIQGTVVPVKRGPGRPRKIRTPQDLAEAVLERHAGPATALNCPVCTYDFTLLMGSKVKNVCCPGCGTTFKTMIEKLSAVAKP